MIEYKYVELVESLMKNNGAAARKVLPMLHKRVYGTDAPVMPVTIPEVVPTATESEWRNLPPSEQISYGLKAEQNNQTQETTK